MSNLVFIKISSDSVYAQKISKGHTQSCSQINPQKLGLEEVGRRLSLSTSYIPHFYNCR